MQYCLLNINILILFLLRVTEGAQTFKNGQKSSLIEGRGLKVKIVFNHYIKMLIKKNSIFYISLQKINNNKPTNTHWWATSKIISDLNDLDEFLFLNITI